MNEPQSNHFLDSLLNSLKETRVIILLETAPQSCVFEQIMLTSEKFKRISDAIAKEMPAKPDGTFWVTTNDDIPIKITNGELKTFYTEKEISVSR